eukprot:SAG22_NODE_1571_length_4095_cov_2.849099_4_plen_147_part_00
MSAPARAASVGGRHAAAVAGGAESMLARPGLAAESMLARPGPAAARYQQRRRAPGRIRPRGVAAGGLQAYHSPYFYRDKHDLRSRLQLYTGARNLAGGRALLGDHLYILLLGLSKTVRVPRPFSPVPVPTGHWATGPGAIPGAGLS